MEISCFVLKWASQYIARIFLLPVSRIVRLSFILWECIFSQFRYRWGFQCIFSQVGHIWGCGVQFYIFRKRAPNRRAVARPYAMTHLTVQTCGPQALAKSPQSERSQTAEGLFKSPAAYGSDFMLLHTRKGDRSYEAAGAAVMSRAGGCFCHIFLQSLHLQAACIFSLDRQLSQFAPKPCIFSHTTPVRPKRSHILFVEINLEMPRTHGVKIYKILVLLYRAHRETTSNFLCELLSVPLSSPQV